MSNTLLSVTLLCLCAPPVEKSPTPTTHVYVRTSPSGAKVLLDGKPLGTSPGVFSVEPGVRRIVIDMDGYEPDDKEITIRAGRVTRLEVKLRHRPAGESAGVAGRETAGRPISGVRVLDGETKEPLNGCSLTFSGWGRVAYTDNNGAYRGEGNDFVQRLADGKALKIRHADYQSQSPTLSDLDSVNGLATAYLAKEGNASLTVAVSLTVRGQKTDAPCRVCLLDGDQGRRGNEIRRLERSEDRIYRFSGLAPGDYTIEAYFWDSYPIHYEPVHLAAGENKVVHIDSKTDEIARIRVEGVVLDKRSGKPVEGLRLHFCGAPDDNVLTDKDGRFSAVGDRSRFHQTYLYEGGNLVWWEGGKLVLWAEMDNHMSEESARKLEFHVDPTRRDVRVSAEDQDGVFCDGQDCAICARKVDTPENARQGPGTEDASMRQDDPRAVLREKAG